jgi:CRP/FNR family transcriptional regulator, cyclic AMP receptor protein
MISPETLRFYPFFGGLTNAQLQAIAIISAEETYPAETILFEMGLPADKLYFLEDGCIDLYYSAPENISSAFPKGIPVGEINPGEAFSISALIEPYVLSSTARAAKPSRVIQIDAKALRNLFKRDKQMAYLLTKQAAQAVRARLDAARVQLAAAWA